MAKKILSILCALAMMVTMVSVAAFSASAAEPVSMGKITSANSVTTTDNTDSGAKASGYYNTTSAGDSIWAVGYAQGGPKSPVTVTSTIGTYPIADAYTLALDMFFKYSKDENATVFNITAGDLVVTFASNTANGVTASATYDGTALSLNGNAAFNYGTTEQPTAQTFTNELNAAGVTSWLVGNGYCPNRKLSVQIKLEDGTLTVYNNYTSANAFTADLTAAGYDKTADLGETEIKLAVVVNPALISDTGNNASRVAAIGNFSGSYAEVTTGGETPDPDEPGDTPNPEVPGVMGNFTGANWEKWAAVNTGVHGNSGFYNTATAGDSIWASASQTNVRITSTIGTYNISNAYTLNFDLFCTVGTSHQDVNVFTVTIGDVVVTFATNSNNRVIGSATYNGTALDFGSVPTYAYNNFVVYQSTDQTTIQSELAAALTAAGKTATWVEGNKNYYPNRKLGVQIKLENGNLIISTNTGTSTTYTADLTAAGYDKTADLGETDVELAVEINKSNAKEMVAAIGNFSGSFTAAAAEETPAPLAPTGVYPTLNSDLTLNVIYANAADYKDTVEVTATVDGDSQTVSLTEKGGHLVASFDFLTPDQFGSTITLNAVDTNGIAESYSTTYSVKEYCKNMMDNAGSSDDLKALCMALLQFGDSVAVYNGGSSFLSDMADYAAYAPAAWTQGTAAWTYTGTANGAEWIGANLNFADEIGINVYFDADGDASDYTVDASFGTESDVIVDGDYFMATIRISSSFLSNQNDVTVIDANGVASKVFTLSVEDWVNANIGKMDDAKKACAIALMTYGDAAAAYGN